MYYKLAMRHSETLIIHLTYDCRFGDEEWVPYTVVALDADENDERLAPGDIIKSETKQGQPLAWVKQVYVDPRTQYRITRNLDGSASTSCCAGCRRTVGRTPARSWIRTEGHHLEGVHAVEAGRRHLHPVGLTAANTWTAPWRSFR